MSNEKIYDIEKRIAELKFLERDLIKDRDIGRLRSLDKAEKSETVEEIVRNFFTDSVRADRKELFINSFPSKFNGRDDEEFMSEVKIEIRFKPLVKSSNYNEMALHIFLDKGFQDDDVRELEMRIMDKLIKIRKDVIELKESKKSLKQNN